MVEALYKPRRPKTSPLYQSISGHFSEFESVYEERYRKRYGVLRDVVREMVYKYLGCGDLKKGFARIKCKSCHTCSPSPRCSGPISDLIESSWESSANAPIRPLRRSEEHTPELQSH